MRRAVVLFLAGGLSGCEADTIDLDPGASARLEDGDFVVDSLGFVRPESARPLNDGILQGILGGLILRGIVIEASEGDAPVLRMFALTDADDPIFPGDNFMAFPGHTGCCAFRAKSPDSGLAGSWSIEADADRFVSSGLDYVTNSYLEWPASVPPDQFFVGPISSASIQGRLVDRGIDEGRISGLLRDGVTFEEFLGAELDTDVDGDGLPDAITVEIAFTAVRARIDP